MLIVTFINQNLPLWNPPIHSPTVNGNQILQHPCMWRKGTEVAPDQKHRQKPCSPLEAEQRVPGSMGKPTMPQHTNWGYEHSYQVSVTGSKTVAACLRVPSIHGSSVLGVGSLQFIKKLAHEKGHRLRSCGLTHIFPQLETALVLGRRPGPLEKSVRSTTKTLNELG